jgi:hypothetical protein
VADRAVRYDEGSAFWLHPHAHQAAKGAETIKRVLSNLPTIVQGLAELRGLTGTGHGKEGKARGLQPRHGVAQTAQALARAVLALAPPVHHRAVSQFEYLPT